jgi:2-oxoisovalerate dehydrogenase E1 component
VARITAEDCFIPLADAATLPLPVRDTIVAAALALVKSSSFGVNKRLNNDLNKEGQS